MDNQEYQPREIDIKLAELQNRFKVDVLATKEDEEQLKQINLVFKEGDLLHTNPSIPTNPIEAFELFKNYYAQFQFEVQKSLFHDLQTFNKGTINAEIKEIEDWMNKLEKISLSKAYQNKNSYYPIVIEYLKLRDGFYERNRMTDLQMNENSPAAIVYGRYFLFYEYLQSLQTELKPQSKNNIKTLNSNLNKKQLKRLHQKLISEGYIKDISEIDFIYWLSGNDVNRIKKIHWLAAKTLAFELFSGIILSFKPKVFNLCVEHHTGKEFDSNDKHKRPHSEIIDIIEEISK